MVYSRITLPNVSDDEDRTINRLLEQLERRSPRNQLRANYYDGKRALQQLGYTIPPKYKQLAIVLGWSAKAVDLLARRCKLDGFVWPDGDLEALGMREVWDANHFRTE